MRPLSWLRLGRRALFWRLSLETRERGINAAPQERPQRVDTIMSVANRQAELSLHKRESIEAAGVAFPASI